MDNIIKALILICVPMCLAYFAYRIADRNGDKAKKLTEKIPALIKHKFAIQIGGAVGFVIIFGLICLLTGISEISFYIVTGIILGLINGLAATITYNETRKK